VSLLADAAATVREILNDVDNGFAVPITVTTPDGETAVINGFQRDVGLTIDPETGLSVSGRAASVTLPTADLTAAGFSLPENIPENDRRPWRVTWTPPNGAAQTMKVTATTPDKLGCVVLHLERYVG
jgi:hypothetical protein